MSEIKVMPAEVKNAILKEFKAIAGDDLILSKQEYENLFIKDYAKNGYAIKGPHSTEDTLGTILANIGKKFDNANTNGKYGLNIDEYTDMVYEDKMNEYQERTAKGAESIPVEVPSKNETRKYEENSYVNSSETVDTKEDKSEDYKTKLYPVPSFSKNKSGLYPIPHNKK